jgi:hypothetical protein
MRTQYHEFESLEHILATRYLPGGEHQPIRFVVFGGSGAVGGSSVMELCRLILMSKTLSRRPLDGEIWATGLSDKEISKFVSRLYLALEDDIEIEKIVPLRHYRLDRRIDLRFDILRLQIPADLSAYATAQIAERGGPKALEEVLAEYFAAQACPFLNFVETMLGASEHPSPPMHAAVVAIPLPSVATYTLTTIDRLMSELGLDHATGQRIKKSYLRTFIRGLAVIQQRYARHVVMAHTTAVGGMYRVDGVTAEIRLGFSHSANYKKLVDKKYFADELTQLYLDHGFDVLVTAAAIGIDAVEVRCHLPCDRAVLAEMRRTQEAAGHDVVRPADLDTTKILLYPARKVPLVASVDVEDAPLRFEGGKELMVDTAIRSGENGLFSVANCVALYHVMKVAIPEELAMVLVRRAVFGPERRRDWFDNKICYYNETENSYFAVRLLDSYPELVRSHHAAFAIQAYQALGSSCHQARLHEISLVMLVLRLRELGRIFEEIPEKELSAGISDLDGFFWRHTRIPALEDLEGLEAEDLAHRMTLLCETHSVETVGRLLGYDPRSHGLRERGREEFLNRLATALQRYLQTITSLGIPILYRGSDARDHALVGPYVAPLDRGIASVQGLEAEFRRRAERHGVDHETYRDWVVVNNGFVDLRPHALATAAQEAGPGLAVARLRNAQEVQAWIASLDTGSYFTTAGIVALLYRLERLRTKVCRRRLQLGTRETWKHLFQQDSDGRHWLTPGLVETVRMYSEGVGKVTGTEALWPPWGY